MSEEKYYPTREDLPEFEGKRGPQPGSTGLMLENYIAKLLAEGFEDEAAVVGTVYEGLVRTNYTRPPAHSDLRPAPETGEAEAPTEQPASPTAAASAAPVIYTFGTQKRGLDELVAEAEGRDAVVLDVRYRAASRVADWNKARMSAALGERYRHARAFGNLNYKKHGAPIDLADPEAGVAEARAILDAGQSVILVCYEEDPADCHRSTVATLLKSQLGHPVEHLLRPGFTARMVF
jgi:hypothetical protein